MSNKRDLRAFVRFDGSGRIVAGSLILRKNKPKVGKWHEIQAYECCNYIPSPSTTTTTTQGGGGGGFPFELFTGPTAEIACEGFQGTVLWFVAAPGENQVAYVNEALTIPYANSYIQRFGDLYLTNSQGVMQYINNCAFITTTTTTTIATINVGYNSESCGTPSTFTTVSFATGSNICDPVVELQGNFSMLPSTFYVIYGGFSRLFSKISDSIIQGAGGAPGECVSCG
jgi:hypothetical protein